MTELATQELARARAARIRAGIQTYLHTLADVSAAYAQRDWTALGYADWQSYVDGEYGAERLRLSPEHRQKAVAELRLAGMSQRAIGSALGVSAATVNRDLGTVPDETVPTRITGLDGREQPATRTDHPGQTGEEPTPGLAAPVAPDASEVPTGVTAPTGAGADEPAGETGSTTAGGDTSPPPAVDPLADALAKAQAKRDEVERHNAWARDLDEQMPAEVKAYSAELGRRVGPVISIANACEFFLDTVRDVDPERAVTEAPEQLRHKFAAVPDALAFLTRVADAMKPKEVAA